MAKSKSKDSETITISKEEYDQLVKDSDFLNALQSVGVDNWEGYSDAFDFLENSDEDQKQKKEVIESQKKIRKK